MSEMFRRELHASSNLDGVESDYEDETSSSGHPVLWLLLISSVALPSFKWAQNKSRIARTGRHKKTDLPV